MIGFLEGFFGLMRRLQARETEASPRKAAELFSPPSPSASDGEELISRSPDDRYVVSSPAWLPVDGYMVSHLRTGRLIATTATEQQAFTLCDTLNLVCGNTPSLRLLKAALLEPVLPDRREKR